MTDAEIVADVTGERDNTDPESDRWSPNTQYLMRKPLMHLTLH